MAFAAGKRLGVYEIIGLIGVGGMGEVYRATDTKLGRKVAIKTLPSELANDADRLARFEREAKLLAAINHSHIAQIYGLHEHEGTQFLAMELVEGETLERTLKGAAMPVSDALRLGLQIAEALEAAHEKGVVHRDLKPANIMVTPTGAVKVLDFGLAKAFSGNPGEASPAHSPALSLAMTQRGLILGTAGYMSPEQASGQATDQRADVWAFGVVLFEMVTGAPLFSGESVPHILADVLRTDPDWARLPKNLHPRVKLLLERCLEKKLRNRYHGIADARVDIEKILSDPRGVTGLALASAAAPTRSTFFRVAIAGALVAAGATIAGIVGWSHWPEAPRAASNRWAHVISDGLTRNRGRQVLALSPDGRQFVYNASDGLHVRSMDELETRRIGGTEESVFSPFFSPDGQSVAYWTGGELKRVALSGGAPVVIAGNLANLLGASWESDGTILLGQPDGIYRVSANGGTPERVVVAEDGERLYGAELLPDQSSLLFSVTSTTNWDEGQIVLQSLSTGERTLLLSGGNDARYVPTGHLVYALGDGLYAVAFDAARRTLSGAPVSLVKGVNRGGSSAAAHYAIADDGTLAYVNVRFESGDGALVWVDRDGREEALSVEDCPCASPAVSPDGTRLAFDLLISDQGSDVWVASLAQRTSTRLTFEPGFQLGTVWSPDSTRIAYSSIGEGLYVRPADGTGTPERILESRNTSVVWAWTDDDELIVSEATDRGIDISVMDLTGARERRPLLAGPFNEYRPSLSPDKRWLAYQSDESGQYEIYVRPFADVDAGRWPVSVGGGIEPRWSRDGNALFYLSPTSLMEAAVNEGTTFSSETPKPLLDREPYFHNETPPRSYELSADGQRFLFAKPLGTRPDGASPPQVIIVQNWFEELERLVPTE